MKRILSILLVLIMMLSFAACASNSSSDGANTDTSSGTNTDSDTGASTNTNTSTNTSTNTNTNTSTNTGGSSYVPDYTKDTTNYNPRTNTAKTAIYYINETLEYPTVTKYKNGAKAALSMTFDDANNANAGRIISEVFAKYDNKMHGTIMATVNFMKTSAGNEEQSIQAWQSVFDLGYLDLGCHGYRHADPTDYASASEAELYAEVGAAFEYLRAKFPTQRVLTYATPLARINDNYESYLRQWCLSNRLEAGGNFAVIGESYNIYRMKASMIQNGTNLRTIYESVQASVDAERWIVHLFHDIIEDDQSSGWNPTYRSTFESYCEHLYSTYGDTVWFGSFEEVTLYALQYENITIEYTAASRESMTLSVDCDMDSSLYNIPVGVKVQLPRFTDSAIAFVNGVPQQLELDTSVRNKVYTVIKDVPIYDTEIVIMLGGNTTFRNGCAHSYAFDSTVEATPEEIGYSINKCQKCECTYKSDYVLYVESDAQ